MAKTLLHGLTRQLLSAQNHLQSSICHLHSGTVSQRFWNLLHLSSVEKANPPLAKKRRNVVTSITTTSTLPLHEFASLTKKATRPIYNPRQSAYTFVNEDTALPRLCRTSTVKRCQLPDKIRDAVPQTPWHRARAPVFPKHTFPPACEVEEPVCEEPCPPEPSSQTSPDQAEPSEECQAQSCPSNPCDPGPRPKPTSCLASKDCNSPGLNSNIIRKCFFSDYEPPKMAKRNVLWTFLRDWSSMMDKVDGNKKQLIIEGLRPHRVRFQQSRIMSESDKDEGCESVGRRICTKGSKSYQERKKKEKKSRAASPSITPGKQICTKPRNSSYKGGCGGSASSTPKPVNPQRSPKVEPTFSPAAMVEPGSKKKVLAAPTGHPGNCHPDESWKGCTCFNTQGTSTCSTHNTQCNANPPKEPKRSYLTTAMLSDKSQTKRMLIVPARSIKFSEPTKKDPGKEVKKEDPEVTAETLTKEILEIEERIAAIKYGIPLKKKKTNPEKNDEEKK